MSKKPYSLGGYQIIDLQGKDLTEGVGMVYEGIFDLIHNTRKVILLSNVKIEGVVYKNMFIELTLEE